MVDRQKLFEDRLAALRQGMRALVDIVDAADDELMADDSREEWLRYAESSLSDLARRLTYVLKVQK